MTSGGERGGSGVRVLGALLAGLAGFALWNAYGRSPRASEPESAVPGDPLPPGWGAFVVGAPSGREPARAAPERPPAPREAVLAETPRTQEEYELSPASDFELTVQPGQVLSRIVQVYYGAAEPELVSGLAEYNGLADPDALRAGATLRLPSERRLRRLAGGDGDGESP